MLFHLKKQRFNFPFQPGIAKQNDPSHLINQESDQKFNGFWYLPFTKSLHTKT